MIRRHPYQTRLFVGVLFSAIVIWGSSSSLGQQENNEIDDLVELSNLDTFLKNKDGRLIQYFKITFEEFERVYNTLKSSKDGAGAQAYSIRSAEVITRIRDKSADLEIELDIEPRTDQEIVVPVGFNNSFFPTSDSNRLLFRGNQKFYVRIKGKVGVPIRVTLNARKTIKRIRGRKQLELDLPSATFTKVEIHDVEPEMIFSASQDSISRQIEPLFEKGSAYEFSGLKENAVIAWSLKNEINENRRGEILDGAQIEAIVFQDRVEYQATFSIKSNDAISEIEVGLPKNATGVKLGSFEGQVSLTNTKQDAWKNYRVDFGRFSNTFEDVVLNWTVTKKGPVKEIVGFELTDFTPSGGQLVVSGDDGLSFVLANPFNLENENRNLGNGNYSYSFQTTVVSATVFTISNAKDLERQLKYRLRLDGNSAGLEIELIPSFLVDNPAEISIHLNGWKPKPGQENISVDSLLREVVISPAFFLLPQQRKTIEFILGDKSFLGEKEIRLPSLKNGQLDSIELEIRCRQGVEALFKRNQNPGFDLNSEFEVESISSEKELVLTADSGKPAPLKLTVKPVIPLVEAHQEIKLFEAKGRFHLSYRCEIESSKPFDSCAVTTHTKGVRAIKVDGEKLDILELVQDSPFVLKMDRLTRKVSLEIEVDPGELSLDESTKLIFPEYLLPVTFGSVQNSENSVDILGNNFGVVPVASYLKVLTPLGTTLTPDSKWIEVDSAFDLPEKRYEGRNTTFMEIERSKRTEDEIQVSKAWCHTALNNESRQDRVIIRFFPNRSLVEWKIPEGAKLVSCKLNGKKVTNFQATERHELVTGFDDFGAEQIIEFELQSTRSRYESKLSLNVPRTSRLLWPRNLYWSIELPDNQYVLNYSNGLSASYILAWTGFFLKPTPKLTARQVEDWIGTRQQAKIDRRENYYLFASFGIADDEHIYIISKRNLVLIFGLFFISLGCAFVSLRFMRNSFLLVTIAAGILIFGMWYPIWFVQLLQIELFVGFLFCLGFIANRISGWFYPAKDETRIETNVPFTTLAAPDSGISRSTQSLGQSRPNSEVP